jgi:hypothetical protein
MAVIGIIVALIGAAVGIVVGVVGGLAGMVLGLLGGSLGLLPLLFPVVLITLGIVWLVKGSNARSATEARVGPGDAVRTQGPHNPR